MPLVITYRVVAPDKRVILETRSLDEAQTRARATGAQVERVDSNPLYGASKIEALIADAEAQIAGGFRKESNRKDCMKGPIARAYDYVVDDLHTLALRERDAGVADYGTRYDGVPSYAHLWKPEHAALFARWPEHVAWANRLAALRAQAKDMPLSNAPKPKTKRERELEARMGVTAMTCQCCGRPTLAETGVVAHHGYERPGGGWQTASCTGARQLPYEASRDRLGTLIGSLKQQVEHTQSVRDGVAAETRPVSYSYRKYRRSPSGKQLYDERAQRLYDTVALDLTRANFGALKVEHGLDGAFDDYKKGDLARLAHEIHELELYLVGQEVRFADWPGVTHRYNGKTWEKA